MLIKLFCDENIFLENALILREKLSFVLSIDIMFLYCAHYGLSLFFSGLFEMAYQISDYDREQEKIHDFLTTFYHEETDGQKLFTYNKQITRLAEREQVF